MDYDKKNRYHREYTACDDGRSDDLRIVYHDDAGEYRKIVIKIFAYFK